MDRVVEGLEELSGHHARRPLVVQAQLFLVQIYPRVSTSLPIIHYPHSFFWYKRTHNSVPTPRTPRAVEAEVPALQVLPGA
eukprot:2167110-Rhodomonas_salina.1